MLFACLLLLFSCTDADYVEISVWNTQCDMSSPLIQDVQSSNCRVVTSSNSQKLACLNDTAVAYQTFNGFTCSGTPTNSTFVFQVGCTPSFDAFRSETVCRRGSFSPGMVGGFTLATLPRQASCPPTSDDSYASIAVFAVNRCNLQRTPNSISSMFSCTEDGGAKEEHFNKSGCNGPPIANDTYFYPPGCSTVKGDTIFVSCSALPVNSTAASGSATAIGVGVGVAVAIILLAAVALYCKHKGGGKKLVNNKQARSIGEVVLHTSHEVPPTPITNPVSGGGRAVPSTRIAFAPMKTSTTPPVLE